MIRHLLLRRDIDNLACQKILEATIWDELARELRKLSTIPHPFWINLSTSKSTDEGVCIWLHRIFVKVRYNNLCSCWMWNHCSIIRICDEQSYGWVCTDFIMTSKTGRKKIDGLIYSSVSQNAMETCTFHPQWITHPSAVTNFFIPIGQLRIFLTPPLLPNTSSLFIRLSAVYYLGSSVANHHRPPISPGRVFQRNSNRRQRRKHPRDGFPTPWMGYHITMGARSLRKSCQLSWIVTTLRIKPVENRSSASIFCSWPQYQHLAVYRHSRNGIDIHIALPLFNHHIPPQYNSRQAVYLCRLTF